MLVNIRPARHFHARAEAAPRDTVMPPARQHTSAHAGTPYRHDIFARCRGAFRIMTNLRLIKALSRLTPIITLAHLTRQFR